MKNCALLLLLLMAALQPACAVTFDETTRYSKVVMNSRLSDFYANTKQTGFDVYDANGTKVKPSAKPGNLGLDYVLGLVGKAVLEAADYYSGKDDEAAKGWYRTLENYGNAFCATVPTSGGSLDDLNATKIYTLLYELSRGKFARVANAATTSNALSAMQNAAKGLKAHDKTYSIAASTLSDAAGGWFHKSGYVNQLWLDGQYMGPALLAQLVTLNTLNGGTPVVKVDFQEPWKVIMNQFDITWRYLWNDETGLLYHAFSATPTASTSAAAWGQEGVYHSQEYWGRAEGWYFLALIDVMEQMQLAGMTGSADYATLRTYLNKMAAGLAAKQDAQTGCWYQLLNYDASFAADTYKGKKYNSVNNYIESSATAIFIASYLKGQRLGMFDTDYTAVAKKAYKGFVEQFIVDDGNGGVHLIGSCRSAGLCGSNKRDGSAAYYLLGPDVTRVTAEMKQTEGKVLGAFILAAVEYERMADATALACVYNNKEREAAKKYLAQNKVLIETPQGAYSAEGRKSPTPSLPKGRGTE